jgi:hypothetical protein
MSPVVLARAQGLFNLLGGAWPLLHLRSFEALFGPKHDRWLQQAVGLLLVLNGWAQLRAPATPAGMDVARRVGRGTAQSLLAIDLVHVPAGRIAPTYLLDAAAEACWLAAWRTTRSDDDRPARP